MPGRKPKPTMLKDLHGSTVPRNRDEPMPTTAIEGVAPPEHFDEEMCKVWWTAIENAPPGMLKAVDAPALEAWCVAHVIHRKALRQQQRHGWNAMLIKAPGGHPMVSPYVHIINRQALIMARYAAELGFSPTSRPRVGLTLGGADLSTGRQANAGESLDSFLARAPSIH